MAYNDCFDCCKYEGKTILMKAYLVGGAVRDQLLGYPVKERDWVVVGSSPQALIELGYRQVGRDFPVFLHPNTQEEYALARTERKMGDGYYGFACDFNPHITLEEDLARRDLTINAMAMDEQGNVIDPYNGQQDLAAKILRHVSPAFVEDPVRVLRLARFAARYHHLGFRLANETRILMYAMVKRGALAHLVPERVWQEWQRSLEEKNPEIFISVLRSCGALSVISPELDALFGVPNTQHYHPEIDSGVHTLLVLQAAVNLSDDPMVRFAALVHDLGKAATPIAQWPSHHGHEARGVPIIECLCQRLRVPGQYRKLAVVVSKFHLIIHRVYELRANTIVETMEQVDAFRRPALFEQLLQVCEADGRGVGREVDYTQANHWRALYKACATVSASEFLAVGLEGMAVKIAIHKRRVATIVSLQANK